MPIEVRELIIKTEITSRPAKQPAVLTAKDIAALKQQIIAECLQAFKSKSHRDSFNR